VFKLLARITPEFGFYATEVFKLLVGFVQKRKKYGFCFLLPENAIFRKENSFDKKCKGRRSVTYRSVLDA